MSKFAIAAMAAKLKDLEEKVAPEGFQDESGFHCGFLDPSQTKVSSNFDSLRMDYEKRLISTRNRPPMIMWEREAVVSTGNK